MNIRLSEGEIRVRITRDESKCLGNGETLRQEFVIPGGFSVDLQLSLAPDDADAPLRWSALIERMSATSASFQMLIDPRAYACASGPEASSDPSVTHEIHSPAGQSVRLIFEIDLFKKRH